MTPSPSPVDNDNTVLQPKGFAVKGKLNRETRLVKRYGDLVRWYLSSGSKPSDIDIVAIIWGKDYGLFSIKQHRLIQYFYGEEFQPAYDLPSIVIQGDEIDAWSDIEKFLTTEVIQARLSIPDNDREFEIEVTKTTVQKKKVKVEAGTLEQAELRALRQVSTEVFDSDGQKSFSIA